MSGPVPRALQAAYDELQAGRPIEARRALQSLLLDEGGTASEAEQFAAEVDDLLRVGLADEATRRLALFLSPKFPSVGACTDVYRQRMEP